MQDRPTVHELLAAVARFLDEEIVPATDGRRQFLARVAANAVRLVDRELGAEEQSLDAEWQRLDSILGPAELPAKRDDLRAALRRRTDALCESIRAGDADEPSASRAAILSHVRQTVREKLEVSNAAWLAADEGRWASEPPAQDGAG